MSENYEAYKRQRDVGQAMQVGPSDPESMQLWALGVLGGGTYAQVYAKEKPVSQMLSDWQNGIRTQNMDFLLTDEQRKLRRLAKEPNADDLIFREAEQHMGLGSWFEKQLATPGWIQYSDRAYVEALRPEDRAEFDRLEERRYRATRKPDGTLVLPPKELREIGREKGDILYAEYQPTYSTPEEFQRMQELYYKGYRTLVVDKYMRKVESDNPFLVYAAVQPKLSETAAGILERALLNDRRILDSDIPAFDAIRGEDKEMLAQALAAIKPYEDRSIAGAALANFGSMAWDVLVDSPYELVASGVHWAAGSISAGSVEAGNQAYQDYKTTCAYHRELMAHKFKDYGTAGNILVDGSGVVGYMAPALVTGSLGLVGKVGSAANMGGRAAATFSTLEKAGYAGRHLSTAFYAIQERESILDEVARAGGDVTSLEAQALATASGTAIALIENMQVSHVLGAQSMTAARVDAYSRLMHAVMPRIAAKLNIPKFADVSLWKSAGLFFLDGGISTLDNAVQEGFQDAIHEATAEGLEGQPLDWAKIGDVAGESIRASVGAMALPEIFFGGMRMVGGASGMRHTDRMRLDELNAATDLAAATMAEGAEGILDDSAQAKNVRAVRDLFARWNNATDAKEAYYTLLRAGFSGEQAAAMHSRFTAISGRFFDLGLNDKAGPMGRRITVAENATKGWRVVRDEETGDTIYTRELAFEGKGDITLRGRIRFGGSEGAVSAKDETLSASALAAMREDPEMRAAALAAGVEIDDIRASDFADDSEGKCPNPDLQRTMQSLFDRFHLKDTGEAGNYRLTTDEDGHKVLEFDLTLSRETRSGLALHELTHPVQEALKSFGLTEEEHEALRYALGDPEIDGELFNEESAPVHAENAPVRSSTFVGAVVDAIRSLVSKKRWDADKGLDLIVDAMRYGFLPRITSLTPAQKSALETRRFNREMNRPGGFVDRTNADLERKRSGVTDEELDAVAAGLLHEDEGGEDEKREDVAEEAVRKFVNNEPLSQVDLDALLADEGNRLTTVGLMESGYRWDESENAWVHHDDLAGVRVRLDGEYRDIDGTMRTAEARHAVERVDEIEDPLARLRAAVDEFRTDGIQVKSGKDLADIIQIVLAFYPDGTTKDRLADIAWAYRREVDGWGEAEAERLLVSRLDDLLRRNRFPTAAAEVLSDAEVRHSVRRDEPPKRTGIGYKVFVRKADGKLYPPMVANPGGMDTPVGVWLDADAGRDAGVSKTGRRKVKAGGRGTNGGGGTLAYRPGWHLGTIPYALQFNVGPKVPNPLGIRNKKGDVIRVGRYFPDNFVWAEVEYADDVDYQQEAESYGRTAGGAYNPALAGLPRVPANGSYTYRTNPNPATDPWIITGAMRVKKVLTDEEVDRLVEKAGRAPQERAGGRHAVKGDAYLKEAGVDGEKGDPSEQAEFDRMLHRFEAESKDPKPLVKKRFSPFGRRKSKYSVDERRRAYKALADEAYAKDHPDDLALAMKMVDEGVPVSAVLADLVKPETLEFPARGFTVTTTADMAAIALMVRSPFVEKAKIVFVDRHGKVTGARVIGIGAAHFVNMPAAEALSDIPRGTAAFFIAHNHPSGNVRPSTQDRAVTKTFKEYGDLLGLPLLDHIVTDTTKYHSMKEGGDVDFGGARKLRPSKDAVHPELVLAPAEYEVVAAADRPQLGEPSSPVTQRLIRDFSEHDPESSYLLLLDHNLQVYAVEKIPASDATFTASPRPVASLISKYVPTKYAIVLLGNASIDLKSVWTALNGLDRTMVDAFVMSEGQSLRTRDRVDYTYDPPDVDHYRPRDLAERIAAEAKERDEAAAPAEVRAAIENLAGETFNELAVPNDSGMVIEGSRDRTPTRHGVRASIESVGCVPIRATSDAPLRILLPNGREASAEDPIRWEELEAPSMVNLLVDQGLAAGTMDEAGREFILRSYADLLNAALRYGSDAATGAEKLDTVWRWAASDIFHSVKSNGDKQYKLSVDITTICKKTASIIGALSAYQVSTKHGATAAEVIEAYLQTGLAGFQTPCPCCYVFSHWIRSGMLRETAYMAQRHYADMALAGEDVKKLSDADRRGYQRMWEKELERQEKLVEKNADAISKAKETLDAALQVCDDLGMQLAQEQRNMEEGKLFDGRLMDVLRKKIAQAASNAQKAYELVAVSDYAGWIKSCILNVKTKEKGLYEDYRPIPEDDLGAIFDYNRAADAARDYPALSRFFSSKGSAGGKAVETESNNDFGDIVTGLADREIWVNHYKRAFDPALSEGERAEARKKAQADFDKAMAFAARQTLRGGQRIFSWSDNRLEFGPDMWANFVQMQCLGEGVQSYTKQLEGAELISSLGGYNNGSLMARGRGYDDAGRLVFSDVQGIDHEEIFKLNGLYDRSGNILVGMNEQHIRIALADDRIFFVIPWHASSLRADFLDKMMELLGEKSDAQAQDYTSVQGDAAWPEGKKVPAAVDEVWRRAGEKSGRTFRSCFDVRLEAGRLSSSQRKYRELRDRILSGSWTDADIRLAMKDEFLSTVVESLRAAAVHLPSDKKSGNSLVTRGGMLVMQNDDLASVYPYEYWDRSSTYAGADVNGVRYQEYCRRLGFVPKFSGLDTKGKRYDHGDFRDWKGYWKTLIDRRMYDRKGRYQHTEPLRVQGTGKKDGTGFRMELIDPTAIRKRWGRHITRGEDPSRFSEIGENVRRAVESRGIRYQADPDADLAKLAREFAGRHAVRAMEPIFDQDWMTRRHSQEGDLRSIATLNAVAGRKTNVDSLRKLARRMGLPESMADEAVEDAQDMLKTEAAKLARELLDQGDSTGALKAVYGRSGAGVMARAMIRGAKLSDAARREERDTLAAILETTRGDTLRDILGYTGARIGEALLEMYGTGRSWEATLARGREDQEAYEKAQEEERLEESVNEFIQTEGLDPDDVGDDDPSRILARKILRGSAERMDRILAEVREKLEERRERREKRRAAMEGRELPSGDLGDGLQPDEEEAELEAERRIPIEMLMENNIDLADEHEAAAFLRVVVRNRIAEKSGVGEMEITKEYEWRLWKNPTAVAEYGASMQTVLRELASNLLTPNSGAHREVVEKTGDFRTLMDAAAIEDRTADVLRIIARAGAAQASRQTVNELRKELKEKYVDGDRFDDLETDIARKITAQVQRQAMYLRRILAMSERQLALEDARLEAQMDRIADDYQEARGVDERIGADEFLENQNYKEALWRRDVLSKYGGMRYETPSTAMRMAAEVRTWMEKEAEKFAGILEEFNATVDAWKEAIKEGCARKRRDGSEIVMEDDDQGFGERAYYSVVTSVEMRLRDIFRYSQGEARRRAEELVLDLDYRLSTGSVVYERVKQDMLNEFVDTVESVVGKGGARAWVKHLEEPVGEEESVALSKQGRRSLSYDQALQLYLYLCQTSSYGDNIENHGRAKSFVWRGRTYAGQREFLEKEVLTADDLKMANRLRGIYKGRRNDLSAMKEKVTGIGFGEPDPFYAPVKMKTPAKEGLDEEISIWKAMPDVFSERRRNGLDCDESAGALQLFMNRMDASARVMAFGETGVLLLHTFGAGSVKDTIRKFHGRKALDGLIDQLTDWANGGGPRRGHRDAGTEIEAWLQRNLTYCALWGNLLTAFKQTLSAPVYSLVKYADDRSVWRDFSEGVGGIFSKSWRQAFRELTSSEDWKARYGSGGIMEEVHDAVMNSKTTASRMQRIVKIGMSPIQFGDATPTILVGVAAYRGLRDKLLARNLANVEKYHGDSDLAYRDACAEAARHVMMRCEKTQQSSQTQNLPAYSRRGKKSMWMMFASSPVLQMAWEMQHYREWRALRDPYGDGKTVDSPEARVAGRAFANAVIVNHVVMPCLFNLATLLWNTLLGKYRDEPPDEKELASLVVSMILGPFNRFFLYGACAEALLSGITGNATNANVTPSVASMLERAGARGLKLGRDVLDAASGDGDWDDVLPDLEKFLGTLNAPARHIDQAVRDWTGTSR